MSHDASDDQNLKFNDYSELPPDLVPTSEQVLKFAGQHVVAPPYDKRLKFSWDTFTAALREYAGDELTFDTVQRSTINRQVDSKATINQQEAEVESMAMAIVDFLKDVLRVILSPQDVVSLKNKVRAAFIDLKTAAEESGLKNAWEYRVYSAFANPDIATDFYAFVSTIKFTVDISKKTSWWGLQSSATTNFSAEITSMRLIVTQGFVNPEPPQK